MKIAVFHNSGAGGARRYLHMHVRELVRAGHEVRSWCFSTASQDYLPMSSIVPEQVIACPLVPYAPSERRRLARLMEPESLVRNRVIEACAREAVRSIEQFTPDVVLVTNCMLSSVPPIARFTKLPTVLVLHEPWRNAYEANPRWPWLSEPEMSRLGARDLLSPRALLDAWERWREMDCFVRAEVASVKACGRILVNSHFSRENTKRCYGLNAVVSHHGVDSDYFTPDGRARNRTVLGVGAFGPHKNAPLLINALATIPATTRPDLMWIGGGGSRSFADGLVRLAAEKQVRLDLRWSVTDSELRDLYRSCGALVFVPWLEPFGLVPLEANACGLPAIVLPEGGLRETCADGVNAVFVEEDERAVAGAVLAMLDSPGRRTELGASARRWVESRWTVQASAARLLAELQKAAEHAHGSIGKAGSS